MSQANRPIATADSTSVRSFGDEPSGRVAAGSNGSADPLGEALDGPDSGLRRLRGQLLAAVSPTHVISAQGAICSRRSPSSA